MHTDKPDVNLLTRNTTATPPKRESTGKTSTSAIKQIRKILRHLRDDLERTFPSEKMPSAWMIKCLVISCFKDEYTQNNWEKQVSSILNAIAMHTISAYGINSVFYEEDGQTPLFPNKELFGPQHAHNFALKAQNHLKNQLQTTDPNPSIPLTQ